MTTSRRRILIVDDNQAIHDDFRKILCPTEGGKALDATEAALFGSSDEAEQGSGFELDFAYQGQEALTKVCAAWNEGRPYLMAFIDVRMPPGWDGIETTSRIWEIDSYLQVVICTAYSDYSWKQVTATLQQPDRFVILKKPFDVVEVLQLANALTEKWQLLHQAEERSRKLQASEKRYHFLAEAMPCIVWTATPDGKMEYANQWLEHLCGKAESGVSGSGWLEFLHPQDRPQCLERWTLACQSGSEYAMGCRLKRASDGAYRWHLARAVPMRDDKGTIVKWIGTCTDIEDQKRAEEVLLREQAELEKRVVERTQELASIRARLEHLLSSSPAIIYSLRLGPAPQLAFVSGNVSRVLGYEPDEFLKDPRFWADRLHPDEVAWLEPQRAQLLAKGHQRIQHRFRHKDGSYRWMQDDARVISDAEGRPAEIVGSWTDVTERRQMEEALRESETRYRGLVESQGEGVVLVDKDMRFTFANPAAENILGVWSGKLLGRKLEEFMAEKDRPIIGQQLEFRKRGEKSSYEIEVRTGSGQRRQILVTGTPQFDDQGGFRGTFAVFRDITERKKAEEALRQSEERIRMLVAGVKDYAIFMLDPEGRIVSWNSGAERIIGYPAHEIISQHFSVFYPPDALQEGRPNRLLQTASAEGRVEEEGWRQRKDGTRFWASMVVSAMRDDTGALRGFSTVTRDITERRLAEEKSRVQTSALEAAANGIVISDRTGKILWVNPAFTRLTGYASEEAVGQTPAVLKSGRHDAAFYERMWQTILGGKPWHGEVINRRKDGQLYHEEMTITPVLDEKGEIQNFVAVKQDITRRKEAERESQMMEVQLRQGQKLESIGQLAAGIAHEINTPTQYVGDNTRFLKDAFESIAKVLRSFEDLLNAAKSGTVTPELLARVEQTLVAGELAYLFEQIPAAVHETLEGVERVTKIVRAMKEFSHPGGKEKAPADLNKAIESTVTVARNEWKYVAELELHLATDLPDVPCFLGEFNQVILNLVVNAAHAIAEVVKDNPGTKGKITITTRRDGEAVEVRVADTGSGIPEAVRPKIFEPFFTTKEVGKGTGQGLAIVYGSIVKKHGGAVSFESEVGQGTTFVLRLPIAPSAAGKPSGPVPAPEPSALPIPEVPTPVS